MSAVTVSNIASSGSASSGQTASTASMVHPPAKTAIRRKHTRSVSLSRSWLHSMAASRVRCRGSPARLPPVSSRNLLPSRADSCATVSALTRAAASSMASGMPSSWRQMSLTAARVLRGQGETGAGQRGAVAEQPDRLSLGRGPRIPCVRRGHGQRRDRPARLARHAQPGLAGGQDPKLRTAAQQGRDHVGGGVDDVFAVVHDQQGLCVPQPSRDAGQQGPAGLLPRRQDQRDGGDNQIRAADRGQLHQPYPVRIPSRCLGTCPEGEAALPAAARAGQRDQPGQPEQFLDRVQLGFPADEGRGLRRQPRHRRLPGLTGRRAVLRAPVARGRPRPGLARRDPAGAGVRRRMPVKTRILAQDPFVQAAQVGAWIDAKLFGEPVPELRVGAQRLRLAAAPVQREDPLPGEPLPERVPGGQSIQLRDQAGVPAAGQVGLDPVLQRGQPGFFQAAGIRLGEGHIGHVRQGRAAPQVKGLAQGRAGSLGPASGQVPLCRGDQALETGGVKLVLGDVELVTGWLGEQDTGLRAEHPAQPGNVDPQRGRAVRRWLARPQIVGQPVGRHGLVRRQQQPGQQRAFAQPAEVHGPPVVFGLDRTEYPELHLGATASPEHADLTHRKQVLPAKHDKSADAGMLAG